MNRIYLRYAVIFLFALILQSTIVKSIQIVYWKPDLVLVILVIFSIQWGKTPGATVGFLVGCLGDLISGGLLGVGALSKSITGYVAGGVSKFFQERTQFILTLFISGFLHDLIFSYISTLGRDVSWRIILFVYMIPNLFYTALIGTFIYYLLGRWGRELE